MQLNRKIQKRFLHLPELSDSSRKTPRNVLQRTIQFKTKYFIDKETMYHKINSILRAINIFKYIIKVQSSYKCTVQLSTVLETNNCLILIRNYDYNSANIKIDFIKSVNTKFDNFIKENHKIALAKSRKHQRIEQENIDITNAYQKRIFQFGDTKSLELKYLILIHFEEFIKLNIHQLKCIIEDGEHYLLDGLRLFILVPNSYVFDILKIKRKFQAMNQILVDYTLLSGSEKEVHQYWMKRQYRENRR